MNLLITLDFLPERGGIQDYLYSIVQHTFSANDCVLVGCNSKNHSRAASLQQPVIYCSLPFSRFNKKLSLVPLFFNYIKLLKNTNETISVSCGNVYAAIVPWLAGFFIRQPYSIYIYGTEMLGLSKRSFKQRLLRSVYKRCHKTYAISTFTASLLAGAGISKNVELIPPKITLSVDSGNCRRPSISNGCNLLAVGRLVPHKGHAVLLNAMAMLPLDLNAHLTIVGNGPQYKNLTRLTNALGISHRVEFKTSLSDETLMQEYYAADIFILPSLQTSSGVEGFGIVLLYAMLNKTPIIASRSGGIPEVLDNGTCGLLVGPGNPEQLKNAVLNVLTDPDQALTRAQLAHERALKNYVWQ